jgi:hypothetical protein
MVTKGLTGQSTRFPKNKRQSAAAMVELRMSTHIGPGQRLIYLSNRYGPGRYYVIAGTLYVAYYAGIAVFANFLILSFVCSKFFLESRAFVLPVVLAGFIAFSFALPDPIPAESISKSQQEAAKKTPRWMWVSIVIFVLAATGGKFLTESLPPDQGQARHAACEFCNIACDAAAGKPGK